MRTSGPSPSPSPDPAAGPSERGAIGPSPVRRFVLPGLVVLAVAAFADLPYQAARRDVPVVSALASPPPGAVAVYPTMLASEDYPQYLAAIRESARTGRLASRNPFSSEPHRPILLRPFYAALGVLAGATGLEAEAAYRLASWFGRLAFLIAVYWAAGRVFPRPRERWIGFAMVVLVSGLDGLLFALARVFPEATLAQGTLFGDAFLRYREGIERSEVGSFLLLFHHPHLQVAAALILVATIEVADLVRRPRLAGAGRLLLWTFALSVTNLFSLVPLAVVAGSLAVARVVEGSAGSAGSAGSVGSVGSVGPVGPAGARVFGAIAFGGLGGVPFLAYAVTVYSRDPFWSSTYGTASGQSTPGPDVVFFHLAIVVVLAAIGVRRFLGSEADERVSSVRRAAVAWVPVGFVLAYLPLFDFPVRLLFGVHPFLALVAVSGVGQIARSLRAPGVRAAVFGGVAALAVATPIGWVDAFLRSVAGESRFHYALVYRPVGEVEAVRWLASRMEPGDVILSGYESGNFLGGRVPGAVYLGHGSGTADFERKEAEVASFFSGTMGAEGSARFLSDAGVDWIWYGNFEQRDFGVWTEERLLGGRLEVAHSVPGAVFVFRVHPDPRETRDGPAHGPAGR